MCFLQYGCYHNDHYALVKFDFCVILRKVLNEINSKENLLRLTKIKEMFEKNPSFKSFLKDAGFIEAQMDDEEVLLYTKNRHSDLMDLYAVSYFFAH